MIPFQLSDDGTLGRHIARLLAKPPIVVPKEGFSIPRESQTDGKAVTKGVRFTRMVFGATNTSIIASDSSGLRKSSRRAGSYNNETSHTSIYHTPVMAEEVLDALQVKPGGTYIDATLGEGGHAEVILKRSTPKGHLLGVELDPFCLTAARKRLQPYWTTATLVRGNYRELSQLAHTFGFANADGILFDFGLSSAQLEGEDRGFTFLRAGPLDMRFDTRQTLTAEEVVNRYSFLDLVRVIREYGEEPKAETIARVITASRPIRDTLHLANVVTDSTGGRHTVIHPATRTFQAIRMEVNGELDNIHTGLEQALMVLKKGGRLVTISYHSLEDRVVKEFLRRESRHTESQSSPWATTTTQAATLRLVIKKVVRPSEAEMKNNPRSRSAKMRVAERI